MDENVLKGLSLYEHDFDLLQRLDALWVSWRRAYPDVNLKEQIAWAHAWEVSNPRHRKKNKLRFLNNWMKNEQRKHGAKPVLRPYLEHRPPEDEILTGDDFKRMREVLECEHVAAG